MSRALEEAKRLAKMDRLNEIAARRSSRQVDVGRLPFRVLPPGEWTTEDIVAHYRNIERTKVLSGLELQWSRIWNIQKLQPTKVWIGSEAWVGYAVYEFAGTQNVVLECPVKGNAIYVLHGSNWKELILLSKGEIRKKHAGSYHKIVHKGEWPNRIKRSLYQL